MKVISLILAFICCFVFSIEAQDNFIAGNVHKKWETPAQLMTPESVKYDQARNVIYVSNINGNPSEKDGNGFISKLSPDGRIIDLKWVVGLDAPKGMGIIDGHLYVTNITEIVEIEISSGKILNRYKVAGSVFLNDIDTDEKGVVYFSDSGNGKVFRLKNGKVDEWLKGSRFEGANGLSCSGFTLYIGTRNALLAINTSSGSVDDFAVNTGSIDGLEYIGTGSFLFSDWNGSVYKVSKNSPKELLLNTSSSKINAADIEYIPASHLLLVPTFFDNRVMAYAIK
jgi:hypothetical protein